MTSIDRFPLRPGVITELTVYHDDDCPFLTGRGVCTCADPEMELRAITDEIDETPGDDAA